MSVIILKDEHKTMIVTVDKRYVINQYPDKGIELSIEIIKPTERFPNELEVRLSIPIGTKTLERDAITESAPEVTMWPIPLKVLEDIQERTNGDIKIEDISEYNKKIEPGKEFFIRIKGYILITEV